MNRPTGVTVIAVLYFIGAAFFTCLGLVAIIGGSLAGVALARNSGIPAGIVGAVGALIAVVLLCLAALYLTVGIGLWKLKEWARIISIVLASIGLCVGAIGLLHFNPFSLIRICIAGVILWYMLQPHVRAAFGARSMGVTAA